MQLTTPLSILCLVAGILLVEGQDRLHRNVVFNHVVPPKEKDTTSMPSPSPSVSLAPSLSAAPTASHAPTGVINSLIDPNKPTEDDAGPDLKSSGGGGDDKVFGAGTATAVGVGGAFLIGAALYLRRRAVQGGAGGDPDMTNITPPDEETGA